MREGVAGRRTEGVVWAGACALAVLVALPLATAWKLAPDLGHGWAAPLLIGYLWWERWAKRPALRFQPVSSGWWLVAGAVTLLALPLRLLLIPFPLWPALIWAYVLLLVGVALAGAWLLAGWPGVKWLVGPLTILAAALPWTSQIDQHFIYPLRAGLASLTAEVSNILGRPAIAAGTSVRLGSGWIGVDEACGGIRSLQASVMLALFFGEWLRFSVGRRLALIVAAIAAAVFGNFLRILFLSLRAASGAAAFFSAHDAAGWLALAFSLALTGLLAGRWSRADRKAKAGPALPSPMRPSGTPPRTAAGWILLMGALLATDEGAARWWYARGSATETPVPGWTARLPEDAPAFRAVGLSEENRELLVPDAYVAGNWALGPETMASAYYIEWQKGQVARFVPFLHNPTVCLPLAGCELEKTLGDLLVPGPQGDLPFHNYIFRRAGEDLAVAFLVWDTARGRPLEQPTDLDANKWSFLRERWQEVREARIDQPAQLLSVAISGRKGEERMRDVLSHLVVGR